MVVVAAVFATFVVVAATFTLRVNFTVEEVKYDFIGLTAASVEHADSARFEHCNGTAADSTGKHHIDFLLKESVDDVGLASAALWRIELFLADDGLCFIVNLEYGEIFAVTEMFVNHVAFPCGYCYVENHFLLF
jgi:hypothetical protein